MLVVVGRGVVVGLGVGRGVVGGSVVCGATVVLWIFVLSRSSASNGIFGLS